MRTLNRPMFRMGGPIKEGIMHGIREPHAMGNRVGFKKGNSAWTALSTVAPKVTQKISSGTKDLWPRTKNYFSNIYKTPLSTSKEIVPYDKAFAAKQMPGIGTNRWWWQKAARPTLGAVKKTAGAVAPYGTTGALGYLGYQGTKGLFGGDKTIDENIDMSTIIPGGPGGAPGGGDPNMTYTDPEAAKKLADKRRDERVNNLLETMGYDTAKKDAIGKALVDASQIVTERGTLDPKNITQELISPIIQATSKRLEKPEALNEAVRLMMTKAEIEKEMNPLKDEALRVQIAAGKKTLAGGTLQEAVLDQTLKQGAPTGATLSQIARAKGIDNKVLPIKIPKNQDTLEVATEVITDTWKNAATVPDKVVKPGFYVGKDRIILVEQDGSIKPYL